MPVANAVHKIKKGDTLEKLAKKHKIKDWKKLWKHKSNQTLFKKRGGDEKKLEPGDELKIPAELLDGGGADDKKPKPELLIKYKGKTYGFTKKEYEKFKKDLIAIIKRGPVLGMKKRVFSARGFYDGATEFHDDQYFVSWLIDTTRGVSLPPEKIIKDAEVALKIVESAIKANDLKKLQMAMKYAEAPIDKAISVMGKYHDNWTKGAGNWITGCEVTKTVSFTIVAVAGAPIAASAGAGAVASGAIASGGAALLEAVAHETGTALAGSETQTVGSAAWNVFKKTLISAGIGAVLKGKYAEKIVEGVGAQLVKRTGSSVLKRFVTSEKTITVLVRKVLKNASVSGLESAMEETVKLMTDPKAKPEEFFATVAKKMATGGFLGELDGLVEKNLAPGIVDKIPAGRFAEVFGNMSKKNAAKFIEGMITKSYGNAIESAFDSAVTKMTGKETPKQLVDNVAKNFAKSRAMNEVLDDLMEKYGDKIRK